MAEPLRHRQTKEAATDMFSLQPTRHISTLHIASFRCGAKVQTRLEVKRTCRDRRHRIDPTRLTRNRHLALYTAGAASPPPGAAPLTRSPHPPFPAEGAERKGRAPGQPY